MCDVSFVVWCWNLDINLVAETSSLSYELSTPYSGCQVVWLCYQWVNMHNYMPSRHQGRCSVKKIGTFWTRCSLWSWCSSCQCCFCMLRLQRHYTTRLDMSSLEATSGASTTLVATSNLQGHWHVGHWRSYTGTGPRFVESGRCGLRARRAMMMMMCSSHKLTKHCSTCEWWA